MHSYIILELIVEYFIGFVVLVLGLLFLMSMFAGNTSPREELDKIVDDSIENAKNSEYRNLNLDALINLALRSFDEVIDKLKSDFDPLVRLAVCHIFIEQLSPNYNEENNSSISEFSFHFFKDQLSDDDMDINFGGDAKHGDGYFENPIFWAGTIQSRIETLLGNCADDEDKLNMCVHICVDIATHINDDEMMARFVEFSKEKLKDKELMTKSAESVYSSLEL